MSTPPPPPPLNNDPAQPDIKSLIMEKEEELQSLTNYRLESLQVSNPERARGGGRGTTFKD